jgi:putative component of toxin-antitoxin plasmid stabilization module
MGVIEIRRYVNRSGIDVIGAWLARLEDLRARARIVARLDLCGGDKRGQSSDIKRAIDYLKDFKERTRSK